MFNDSNISFSNVLMSLSTFLIWLGTFIKNNTISVLTVLVLILTALNQYYSYKKNKADYKKIISDNERHN